MLRRRHVVCQGTLGSPVRRSQRLAGRRTPVGVSKIESKVNCSGTLHVVMMLLSDLDVNIWVCKVEGGGCFKNLDSYVVILFDGFASSLTNHFLC